MNDSGKRYRILFETLEEMHALNPFTLADVERLIARNPNRYEVLRLSPLYQKLKDADQ
jgi:hypothetical protein